MRFGRRNRAPTDRQLEVAVCVATGLTNLEIAEQLHVTADTVKHHVTAVMTKLDMSNRTQVAAWVLQQEVDLDAAEEAS